jgi:hypothetical protein
LRILTFVMFDLGCVCSFIPLGFGLLQVCRFHNTFVTIGLNPFGWLAYNQLNVDFSETFRIEMPQPVTFFAEDEFYG